MSECVGKALREIARQIGPGVEALSFAVELEGGAIRLTPENLELEVRCDAAFPGDGACVFTGQWRDVRIEWMFTPKAVGMAVSLRAAGEHPLRCRSLESLIIRYRSEGADLGAWRVPTKRRPLANVGMLRLDELDDETATGTLMRGLFRDSRTPGLFAGTLLPQRHSHQYHLTRDGEDTARLTCATHFIEGPAQAKECVSETSWVCATRTARDAIETLASFVPVMDAPPAPPVGWNSWDYYFAAVWLDDIIENMDAIRADPVLSRQVGPIVIDMGWSHTEGDWYPNYRFPGGLEATVDAIRSRGFTPGIWTAPLMAQPMTVTALRHYEMFVKNQYGDPESRGGHYVLDPTHPKTQEYLRELYTRLYQAGFRFFKVDYVSDLVHAERLHDPTKGPYEALADLFRLIRECVTSESHILGCSLPIECGPGLVDSGRTGVDIHNHWGHVTWAFDYLTLVYPFHNRVWVNDPDFLIVRGRDTSLEAETNVLNPQAHHPNPGRWRGGPVFTLDEARTWASVVLLSGGSIFLSDRISMLNDEGRALLRKAVFPTGIPAVPLDLCDEQRASLWLQTLPEERRLTVVNWLDEPRELSFAFAEHGLAAPEEVIDFWSDERVPVQDGRLSLKLPAHGCHVVRW
ncbi:MAG TPA: alpha-galactosidase [Armatimonadota bacterium]|nr:alpha-galactosidase [Armatimonadota bacterium]HPT97353.1 alpha-galactosidase [Armatimonadota bacterium]